MTEQKDKKIVIVGTSASGKSTFARKLSEKTGLPVVFMDSIMWKPGWEYVGDEETIKKLEEASDKDKWIIEGYITTKARTFLFDKADTIIYLNYSPFVASWRYIKRWWKHRTYPRPELEGSPEEFSFKFLKLILARGEAKTLDMFLAEVGNQDKIVTLRTPKEAESFLENFI